MRPNGSHGSCIGLIRAFNQAVRWVLAKRTLALEAQSILWHVNVAISHHLVVLAVDAGVSLRRLAMTNAWYLITFQNCGSHEVHTLQILL